VLVGANVTATFSQVVDGFATGFTLKNTATGVAVPATVTFNATTRVATLNPTADLAGNTQYTATLTGGPTGIRDLAGNPLNPNVTWSFTTAAAPTPVVTARTPVANATGVNAAGNLTATFNVAITGASGTSFTLTNKANGNSVAAVVTVNATNRIVTLNPSTNLAPGVTYTATINPTGVATPIAAGGVPAATTSWDFTTAATAPGAPVIGTAVAGVAGGPITATAVWTPPVNDGGSAITGYRVTALQMGAGGVVLSTTLEPTTLPASARSFEMTLPSVGNYRFTVQAINAIGTGAQSGRSNQVAGR
jgi:hypothetical protein